MRYIIKTSWLLNRVHTDGYISIVPDLSITQKRAEATVFISENLCRGWLVKAQAVYPTMSFKIVEL